MNELARLFDQQLPIDPDGAIDAQLAAVADKPAVYLLATEDDRPILLASGLAVRSILRRRLGEPIAEMGEPAQVGPPEHTGAALAAPVEGKIKRTRPARRADLRPIVRRLYLKATFSAFETDLWYLWLARRLWPDRYTRLIRRRHCWMIHGDPSDRTPRLTVTDRFEPPTGLRAGPMPDRASARMLVELLTDLFGLCHHAKNLARAPHGRPCEYKEMGRCLGACDGTISMDVYRRQIAEALTFAADAGRAWRTEQTSRMSEAAQRLEFEEAGRIKQRLHRAAMLDHPRYHWLGDADRLDVLIVQPGPRKALLRTFRSFAGRLVVGPELLRKSPSAGLADWVALVLPPPDGQARAEEAGLLTDGLFAGGHKRGWFLRYAGQSPDDLAAWLEAALSEDASAPAS